MCQWLPSVMAGYGECRAKSASARSPITLAHFSDDHRYFPPKIRDKVVTSRVSLLLLINFNQGCERLSKVLL
jgi:hypothetical protein